MTQVILSLPAQADLRSIWLYSAKQWGRKQANTYLAALQAAIAKTAENPDRGKSCDRIRLGYRKLSIGSHVIFYQKIDDGIDVARILHQSMDHQRHL